MQIKTNQTFTIQLTDKEYKTITQALAYLSGVLEARPREEDIEEARALNQKMLKLQVNDLNEKRRVVNEKIAKTVATKEED